MGSGGGGNSGSDSLGGLRRRLEPDLLDGNKAGHAPPPPPPPSEFPALGSGPAAASQTKAVSVVKPAKRIAPVAMDIAPPAAPSATTAAAPWGFGPDAAGYSPGARRIAPTQMMSQSPGSGGGFAFGPPSPAAAAPAGPWAGAGGGGGGGESPQVVGGGGAGGSRRRIQPTAMSTEPPATPLAVPSSPLQIPHSHSQLQPPPDHTPRSSQSGPVELLSGSTPPPRSSLLGASECVRGSTPPNRLNGTLDFVSGSAGRVSQG